jgi:hypothetical protein
MYGIDMHCAVTRLLDADRYMSQCQLGRHNLLDPSNPLGVCHSPQVELESKFVKADFLEHLPPLAIPKAPA